MNVPGYLYCFKFTVGDLAKVGLSSNPKGRLAAIRAMLPFDVDFIKVIGFECNKVAAAWERHILCNANRWQTRGEWVIADGRLAELLDEVSGGEDYTEHFKTKGTSGRPMPIGGADTLSDVYKARLVAATSVRAAATINYDGDPDGLNEAIVYTRLSEGYGSEDIAIITGIPLPEVRAHIEAARSDGILNDILGITAAHDGPTEFVGRAQA